MKTTAKQFYSIILTILVVLIILTAFIAPQKILSNEFSNKTYQQNFEELEKKYEAHLGVYGIDTGTNKKIYFNENDRFAFASTYKALAGGLVLRNYSWEQLNTNVMINTEDIVEYSPITEKYIGVGLPLKDMISAAVDYSDNTAGNFLFKHLKGPKGYQEELKKIGDSVTDSSRYETDLNESTPGDIRDTSAPKVIAKDLKEIALGDQLPKDKQKFYKKLLIENTTGTNLIAAGVPNNVTVGDKSGAAQYGTRNDIAILYPKNREPIILVVFSDKSEKNAQYQDRLISEAAKIASNFFKL
ncbi:MAG: class A beta-lactamase [Lactobacillaceae bacterium]